MDIKEIRESGLLELYALGLLSGDELDEMRDAIARYPELQKDLGEIEAAIRVYGETVAVDAPSGTKAKILEEIRARRGGSGQPGNSGKSSGNWGLITSVVLALGLIACMYFINKSNNTANRLRSEMAILQDTCNSRTSRLVDSIQFLEQLLLPGNKIIHLQPTAAYASVDIYLHHNEETSRNFIQVLSLPRLTQDQSFQLWSLKPGEAPIPLDVFENDKGNLFEVSFENGTATYAITIEPRGGRQQPTLENLIGTANVSDGQG